MYKEIIFNLFGRYEKQTDVNKDENGKGTHERYNEAIGEDIDTWVQPFISNYTHNHYGDGMFAMFQDARCNDLGVLQFSFGQIEHDLYSTAEYGEAAYSGIGGVLRFEAATNRQIMRMWHKINLWRGTARFIELMARLIDTRVIKVEIENLFESSEYGAAQYSINQYGVSMCGGCTKYNVKVTAQDIRINPYLKSAIRKIIEYNNPIDARFNLLYYNGINIEI